MRFLQLCLNRPFPSNTCLLRTRVSCFKRILLSVLNFRYEHPPENFLGNICDIIYGHFPRGEGLATLPKSSTHSTLLLTTPRFIVNLSEIISYWHWNHHARCEYHCLRSIDPEQHVVEFTNDCGHDSLLLVKLEAVMVIDIVWFIACIDS